MTKKQKIKDKTQYFIEKNKLLFYMMRWQMSTPILAVVPYIMKESWRYLSPFVENIDITNANVVINAIVANLIGSLIFFWVDMKIFNK